MKLLSAVLLSALSLSAVPALAVEASPSPLLGRWSLSFYMLHQPVFIGALSAWVALRGQG